MLGKFPKENALKVDGIEFKDFNSFFDYVEMMYKQGIKEFEELFNQYPVEQWKLDGSNSLVIEPQIENYLD